MHWQGNHPTDIYSTIPRGDFFNGLLILVVAAGTLGWLEASSPVPDPVKAFLRVIVIPLWLMRRVVVATGLLVFGFPADGFPLWYDIATIPALLFPYLFLDVLVWAWRRRGGGRRCRVDDP